LATRFYFDKRGLTKSVTSGGDQEANYRRDQANAQDGVGEADLRFEISKNRRLLVKVGGKVPGKGFLGQALSLT
jgi:hypothetical protein